MLARERSQTPTWVRTGWLVASVTLAVVGVGCARPGPEGSPAPSATAAPPSSAAASAVPSDHLAPDELVEGRELAFGVPLPRGVLVEHRYPDLVSASGPMPVHSLVAYFQPRLRGGSVREGPSAATFEHVSQPNEPNAELTIHIEAGLGKTRIDLTSYHRPEAPVLPDEASRWRQVGLTPQGKILDPTHLH
jgi:hypothetical protein